MSQSPLSRAIREMERELGLVLFVRTTRRVELTPAGSALLERARRALADIEAAVDDARRAAQLEPASSAIGYTPFSRRAGDADRRGAGTAAARAPASARGGRHTGAAAAGRRPRATAAVVMETPVAARRYGVRIDALRDEPLLAALPRRTTTRTRTRSRSAPLPRSVCCCRASRPGGAFNSWLQRGGQGRRVRARADDEDAQRPLGSTHAAGRRRRGRLGRCRRVGGRADRGCRGGAVRSPAELSDRPRVDPDRRRGTAGEPRPCVCATPKDG